MDIPKGEQSFEIVAGERRWRAAQLAGIHTVPVIVKNLDDKEAAEFGIIENVQRENLSPLEEAEAYQRLVSEFHYSHEKLATSVGKSRAHITNMLRILTLPDAIKKMVDGGKLTLGHARALITTRNPVALAELVINKGLNVRQTEDLAKTDLMKEAAPRAKIVPEENNDVLALERELQRVIGLRVKVTTKGKAGSLTLFYKDLDQLDDIIKKLRG
jgi:ParB family chromosome partitioning protein